MFTIAVLGSTMKNKLDRASTVKASAEQDLISLMETHKFNEKTVQEWSEEESRKLSRIEVRASKCEICFFHTDSCYNWVTYS